MNKISHFNYDIRNGESEREKKKHIREDAESRFDTCTTSNIDITTN